MNGIPMLVPCRTYYDAFSKARSSQMLGARVPD